jgi:hypothetical protein
MLKPADALLEPDPRHHDAFRCDAETEIVRRICMEDLRGIVAAIELSERVPHDIRQQFDIARNAFVYSWFVYELSTLAEQQCFATLEMALRHRLGPYATAGATRSPGLHRLIKSAIKSGWLRREHFMIASATNGSALSLLDFIAPLRNHAMHGNTQLLPQGTSDIIRLCADVIERLFAGEP